MSQPEARPRPAGLGRESATRRAGHLIAEPFHRAGNIDMTQNASSKPDQTDSIPVLVTGGAGFIGMHVVRKLLENGHPVLIVDDLSVGSAQRIPAECEFQHIDLTTCTEKTLAALLSDSGARAIIHLAAIHFIPRCMADPERTFAVNVAATHRLVEATRRSQVERFVLASTLDVYGTSDVVHVEEEPAAPTNVYGLSKLLSEEVVAYGCRSRYVRSATALRLANVYGPGETNPHVIPDTLDRLRDRGQRQLKMGSLAGSRDFVFVQDVAEAFVRSLLLNVPGFACLNIGTGQATSVRRVVELLQLYMGDQRPIVEDPNAFRRFDRKSLTPDVTRASELLGWQPSHGLPEGLRATVEAALDDR
jgi:UDP-glucose 4-epimerase